MAKAAKRKTSAKKSPARKTAKRKAPARKTAVRKAPAKRKAPARKTAARRKAPARKKAAPAKRYTATPSRTTDKEHLVALVRDGTDCTIAEAKATLDGIFGTIAASLKKNKRVQLVGFGTFDVRRRAARKGRNPQTGKAMRIKASKNIRFKVSKQIKATL